VDVAVSVETCLPEWGLSWEALGADSRKDWRTRCQNEWDEVRSGLEGREIPASEDQCTDATDDLAAMEPAGACDELRALYLD
jgi:hypothetical protein